MTASEATCGQEITEYQAPLQTTTLTVMRSWIDEHWAIIVMGIIGITLIIGMVIGAKIMSWWQGGAITEKGKTNGKSKGKRTDQSRPLLEDEKEFADKMSQAPTTYKWKYATPCFKLLPELSQGTFL